MAKGKRETIRDWMLVHCPDQLKRLEALRRERVRRRADVDGPPSIDDLDAAETALWKELADEVPGWHERIDAAMDAGDAPPGVLED